LDQELTEPGPLDAGEPLDNLEAVSVQHPFKGILDSLMLVAAGKVEAQD
jgi:hypothetical protein